MSFQKNGSDLVPWIQDSESPETQITQKVFIFKYLF